MASLIMASSRSSLKLSSRSARGFTNRTMRALGGDSPDYRVRKTLPIFPLSVVALPAATVPLMIFEARYVASMSFRVMRPLAHPIGFFIHSLPVISGMPVSFAGTGYSSTPCSAAWTGEWTGFDVQTLEGKKNSLFLPCRHIPRTLSASQHRGGLGVQGVALVRIKKVRHVLC